MTTCLNGQVSKREAGEETKDLKINPDKKFLDAVEQARKAATVMWPDEEIIFVGWTFNFVAKTSYVMTGISGWTEGFKPEDFQG